MLQKIKVMTTQDEWHWADSGDSYTGLFVHHFNSTEKNVLFCGRILENCLISWKVHEFNKNFMGPTNPYSKVLYVSVSCFLTGIGLHSNISSLISSHITSITNEYRSIYKM